jgi:hypothetical protein
MRGIRFRFIIQGDAGFDQAVLPIFQLEVVKQEFIALGLHSRFEKHFHDIELLYRLPQLPDVGNEYFRKAVAYMRIRSRFIDQSDSIRAIKLLEFRFMGSEIAIDQQTLDPPFYKKDESADSDKRSKPDPD